jgi:predicted O-methyltransferase YrrM
MDSNLKQQLIKKFHLENIPPDEAEDILTDAGVVVMTNVITRGIPLLDEAGSVRCDDLLANDAEVDEIFKLLKENVPTFQGIVNEEVEQLEKTLA